MPEIYNLGGVRILHGDCREALRSLPDASVHCCVTSPPYWGLRDYGFEGQIGLEETPEAFVEAMVEVFREVRRVLRDDGSLWLNLGDSYANDGKSGPQGSTGQRADRTFTAAGLPAKAVSGLKSKDLTGIPWRVALALQADGWWLRSDIVWCLSGGARVYARTQKGDMPMSVKDLVRLRPGTVQLWNGEKWTNVLGYSESLRTGEEVEIELRSGERIGCTPDHEWPTGRGLIKAKDLLVGEVIKSTRLPDGVRSHNALNTAAIAEFLGLFMAEGSRSGGTIQISLHAREQDILHICRQFASWCGGSCHAHTYGKSLHVCIEGKVANAIIDTFIAGKTARDKHLSNACWNRDNEFLERFMQGYLAGDGHHDKANRRWRLGFTRNYYWACDLRTICARLGWQLRLQFSRVTLGDKTYKTYRGEIRPEVGDHHNQKHDTEVIAIRKSGGRRFWDIGVEDEPHLFALASGVLTHNSKPNPMPESVTDRPTRSHEYVFLLTKSARYFYDADAIADPARHAGKIVTLGEKSLSRGQATGAGVSPSGNGLAQSVRVGDYRNARTVWTIPTQAYPDAHFATFPEELPRRCIKAGCPADGTALDPFAGSGTVGLVARKLGRRAVLIEANADYCALAIDRIDAACRQKTIDEL